MSAWVVSRTRVLRAIHILERIGTPDARQVLQKLAGGAQAAPVTRSAHVAQRDFATR